MIGFIILVLILAWADRVVISSDVVMTPPQKDEPKQQKINSAWEFKTLDDCMDFRELRATGWKGSAEDFYRWKAEWEPDEW